MYFMFQKAYFEQNLYVRDMLKGAVIILQLCQQKSKKFNPEKLLLLYILEVRTFFNMKILRF